MRTDGHKTEGGFASFRVPSGRSQSLDLSHLGKTDLGDLIPGLKLSVTAFEGLILTRRVNFWESLEILSAFRLFVSDLYSISQRTEFSGEGLTALNELRSRLAELSVQGLEGADYSIVFEDHYVHPT